MRMFMENVEGRDQNLREKLNTLEQLTSEQRELVRQRVIKLLRSEHGANPSAPWPPSRDVQWQEIENALNWEMPEIGKVLARGRVIEGLETTEAIDILNTIIPRAEELLWEGVKDEVEKT